MASHAHHHLLRLLGPNLSQLALATLLRRRLTGLGVKAVVPPAERRGIVANKALVVKIVVVSTSPEGEDVTKRPGEVVTAVGVDGLEEAEDDPEVHGHKVEVVGDQSPDNGAADNAETEEHDFDGRGVLSGETEGGAVGVVELVNRLVEGTVVERAVKPVVPGILEDEEDDDLHGDLPGGREGDTVFHSEVGGDGVEEPDLGEFDGAVTDENESGAFPLLSPCWDLGLGGC